MTLNFSGSFFGDLISTSGDLVYTVLSMIVHMHPLLPTGNCDAWWPQHRSNPLPAAWSGQFSSDGPDVGVGMTLAAVRPPNLPEHLEKVLQSQHEHWQTQTKRYSHNPPSLCPHDSSCYSFDGSCSRGAKANEEDLIPQNKIRVMC